MKIYKELMLIENLNSFLIQNYKDDVICYK